MKPGDIVSIFDGSYSLKVHRNKLVHSSGNELMSKGEFVILASDCALPASESICFDEKKVNDTVLKAVCDGTIVFIQERFLRLIRSSCKCPACGTVFSKED